jgi:hypothetical protein
MTTTLAKALGVVEMVLAGFPAERRDEIVGGLAALSDAFLLDARSDPPGPTVLYMAMLAAMVGANLDDWQQARRALHDAIAEKMASLGIQGDGG